LLWGTSTGWTAPACGPPRFFDDLIGDREHVGRNVEAHGFRGLEIDDQVESDCRQNRQIGGLFSMEDFIDIDRGLAESFHGVGAV